MIRANKSLVRRLVVAQAITILAAGAAIPIAGSYLLHRATTRFEAGSLARQSDQLAGAVSRDAIGWRVAPRTPLQEVYRTGYSGRAFTLLDARKTVLAASSPGGMKAAASAPLSAVRQFFVEGRYFGLSSPLTLKGERLWLVVTEDTDDPDVVIDDVVRSFLLQLAAALLLLMLTLPLVNAFFVRRATRTIVEVSDRAAGIRPNTLDRRLPETDVPSEVAPLVRAVNEALERLEQGFRTQSEFVGNVAHELRTPLALLRLQIDTLAPQHQKPLRATVEAASHVVSQLLDLASVHNLSVQPDEQADLSAVAREVVERLAPAVFDGGRRIDLSAPRGPTVVSGRQHLIEMALTNLVDNAMRHTPSGTLIHVRVEETSLIVEDDGPGFHSTSVPLLTTRFWRGDQVRSDSAGIGLSIVAAIVAAQKAELEATNGTPGGAAFRIRFLPCR